MTQKANALQTYFDMQIEKLEKELELLSPFEPEAKVVEERFAMIEQLLLNIKGTIWTYQNADLENAIVLAEPAADELTFEDLDFRDGYLFKQKLRGGVIMMPEGDNGEYYIPEKMVRDMGVQDGDRVEIDSRYTDGAGNLRYRFSIASRGDGTGSTRTLIQMLEVDQDEDGTFFVTLPPQYVEHNHGDYKVVLMTNDCVNYKIEAGDYIDIGRIHGATYWAIVFKHFDIQSKRQAITVVYPGSYSVDDVQDMYTFYRALNNPLLTVSFFEENDSIREMLNTFASSHQIVFLDGLATSISQLLRPFIEDHGLASKVLADREELYAMLEESRVVR